MAREKHASAKRYVWVSPENPFNTLKRIKSIVCGCILDFVMAKIKLFSEVCWDYAGTITPKLKKRGCKKGGGEQFLGDVFFFLKFLGSFLVGFDLV